MLNDFADFDLTNQSPTMRIRGYEVLLEIWNMLCYKNDFIVNSDTVRIASLNFNSSSFPVLAGTMHAERL
jgi:hypothetical protein